VFICFDSSLRVLVKYLKILISSKHGYVKQIKIETSYTLFNDCDLFIALVYQITFQHLNIDTIYVVFHPSRINISEKLI